MPSPCVPFTGFSPSCPAGDSRFCSAKAFVMSVGMTSYCAINSGFIQMRSEYVPPSSMTSPTPSTRLICGMTLMSR